MKLRNVITGMLMVLIPAFGFAQGKGKGHGQGHGGGKPAKAVKVNQGNPNVYKGKPVKVRTQQPGVYTGRTKGGPPPWAPAHGYRAKQHVYFPDYRFFYDPHRGGYSYWQNNSWAFSPTIPSYMSGIDLGKVRIQLLNSVPLTTRPELYYNRYSNLYPARTVNITIPVPGQ